MPTFHSAATRKAEARLPGLLRTLSLAFGLAAAGLLLPAAEANAVPLSFSCISNNNAGDCAIGEAQLSVQVTDAGGGLVSFAFANSGPAASSVEQVFFDDGALGGLQTIDNGPGVLFAADASPGNLPAGNTVGFAATFSASAAPPAPSNGINPGESLELVFAIDPGASFADVLAALASGDLRIGLHVIAYASGGSESFVNEPPTAAPEPAALLLFGLGLGALALRRRSRR